MNMLGRFCQLDDVDTSLRFDSGVRTGGLGLRANAVYGKWACLAHAKCPVVHCARYNSITGKWDYWGRQQVLQLVRRTEEKESAMQCAAPLLVSHSLQLSASRPIADPLATCEAFVAAVGGILGDYKEARGPPASGDSNQASSDLPAVKNTSGMSLIDICSFASEADQRPHQGRHAEKPSL